MTKVKTAIISDAGVSSRFLPIVKTLPKSLLALGNKPIMHVIIEECMEANLERIIIVTRKETKSLYEDYFYNTRDDLEEFLNEKGKSERFSSVKSITTLPKIEFTTQDPSLPYGTSAPIVSAKPMLDEGEPFIFIQGDDVIIGNKKDCQLMVEEFEKNPDLYGSLCAEEIEPERIHLYGSVKFKNNTDLLEEIIEKPNKDNAPSFLCSYGRFLYRYDIFNYMDPNKLNRNGEFLNVDAVTEMAKEHPVKVLKSKGHWVTTGDPVNYLKAQIEFGLANEENREEIIKFLKNLNTLE